MLDIQTQTLIEQRIANDGKSRVFAILLWLLGGYVGAHRFYVGRHETGIVMFVLFLTGIVTFGIAWIPLVIWYIVDLFLISGMVEKSRQELRASLTNMMTTMDAARRI